MRCPENDENHDHETINFSLARFIHDPAMRFIEVETAGLLAIDIPLLLQHITVEAKGRKSNRN